MAIEFNTTSFYYILMLNFIYTAFYHCKPNPENINKNEKKKEKKKETYYTSIQT